MSTVYVLEPPTKGKVIVNTTYGPLDIELWPKEAPKAVRNFVQLCLEGYYDNTIFHRVIKGFLVQGGDPTGTGTGGESIYGGYFADEFHSRLRFKHRGLVACANAGPPNSNGSQFFMTLDKCDWLDKKNTIFGKVTGDSIFNLLRLGELETDKDDRPLEPPKILSVEVLWNPFDDIVPRAHARRLAQPAAENENKVTKKKAVKNFKLLSFGEEAEEEEKEMATAKQKIRSSHDVLNDPRLLKEEVPSKELNSSEVAKAREVQLSVREALASKKEEQDKNSEDEIPSDDDEASFDARMRQQILKKRRDMGDLPSKSKPKPKPKPQKDTRSSTPKDHAPSPRSNAESSDDDRPKVEKLSLKKKGIGSEARAERMANANTDLQLLDPAERQRQLAKLKKRRLKGREDDVLAKVEKLRNSLSSKQVPSSSENANGRKEDLSHWQSVQLKFAPETGRDRMSRSDDPNDYVVVDPLLEKGKEKFNKMQAKMKRKEREWAGRSLT